jgi:hypothetical protein
MIVICPEPVLTNVVGNDRFLFIRTFHTHAKRRTFFGSFFGLFLRRLHLRAVDDELPVDQQVQREREAVIKVRVAEHSKQLHKACVPKHETTAGRHVFSPAERDRDVVKIALGSDVEHKEEGPACIRTHLSFLRLSTFPAMVLSRASLGKSVVAQNGICF